MKINDMSEAEIKARINKLETEFDYLTMSLSCELNALKIRLEELQIWNEWQARKAEKLNN